MAHHRHILILVIAGMIGALVVVIPAVLSASEVINTIDVRANTGGNKVGPGGEVHEGESSHSIFIRTTVDGEEVIRHEEERSESVEFNASYQDASASIQIDTAASSQGSSKTSEQKQEMREGSTGATEEEDSVVEDSKEHITATSADQQATTTITADSEDGTPQGLLERVFGWVASLGDVISSVFTYVFTRE